MSPATTPNRIRYRYRSKRVAIASATSRALRAAGHPSHLRYVYGCFFALLADVRESYSLDGSRKRARRARLGRIAFRRLPTPYTMPGEGDDVRHVNGRTGYVFFAKPRQGIAMVVWDSGPEEDSIVGLASLRHVPHGWRGPR